MEDDAERSVMMKHEDGDGEELKFTVVVRIVTRIRFSSSPHWPIHHRIRFVYTTRKLAYLLQLAGSLAVTTTTSLEFDILCGNAPRCLLSDSDIIPAEKALRYRHKDILSALRMF